MVSKSSNFVGTWQQGGFLDFPGWLPGAHGRVRCGIYCCVVGGAYQSWDWTVTLA